MQWVEVAQAELIEKFRPANLEPGGQGRRGARAHGLGHGERADALGTLLAGDLRGVDDGLGRGPAGTDDQARAVVGDLALLQAGVGDRLFHRHMGPAGAFGEEAGGAAVDQRFPVTVGRGLDLRAEAQIGVGLGELHARFRFPQGGDDLVGAGSDRGHDTDAGNHDATHSNSFLPPSAERRGPSYARFAPGYFAYRPTRRSLAS